MCSPANIQWNKGYRCCHELLPPPLLLLLLLPLPLLVGNTGRTGF
jgi:hypothetical protein